MLREEDGEDRVVLLERAPGNGPVARAGPRSGAGAKAREAAAKPRDAGE